MNGIDKHVVSGVVCGNKSNIQMRSVQIYATSDVYRSY